MGICAVTAALAGALVAFSTGAASAHEPEPSPLIPPRPYVVPGESGADAGAGASVHSAARPGAHEIGRLAPGTGPVEVLATARGGAWGRIIWGEGTGWVELRRLERAEVPTVPGSAVPVGLMCIGTEPFWDLRLVSESSMRLRQIDGFASVATIMGAAASGNGAGFPAMVWGEGDGLATRLLVRPGACSDGASSRLYGWIGDVVVVAPDRESLLSGCCYLPSGN
jgi:uncharacterized membrane protein